MSIEVELGSFLEDLTSKIKRCETLVEDLLKIETKTYQNFTGELGFATQELEDHFTPLSHINAVCNTERTQEIYAKALNDITLFYTKLSQNLDLYVANKEIRSNDATLSDLQKRSLDLTIQSYELSGADLERSLKDRLQEINIKESELSNDFSQNLIDANNEYELILTDPADLEGLLPSDLESAKFEDEGVTKYRFTLQLPSYLAYMTHGKNASIREELYRAYTTRSPQNAEIIDELMRLRDASSKILGFKNYASYSLETKMAKDESEVIGFLQNLLSHSQKQAKAELSELQTIAGKELKSFDVAYYSQKLKEQKFDIDEELYKNYFEQEQVIGGMFEFLHELFGVEFVKVETKLWHEDATAYDLVVNGELKARLYMDLSARKGKRGGAWMNDFDTHHTLRDGSTQLASAVVVCNFAPATATQASLLRHDDVVTLFHEMGHALHHLLSEVSLSDLSGVNGVEWDAVEFPSQFLENFAYDPSVLKKVAKHYKSKEVITDEMIAKLIESKNFQSALLMLRQLEFALFDMKLHSKLYQGEQIQTLLDEIRSETSLIPPPSYNKFQNGFSHIFAGGYAAGYYSYKYAEVLSADLYTHISDGKRLDLGLANKYREIILQGGGSKSMRDLFFDLMQREPDELALLSFSGIAS